MSKYKFIIYPVLVLLAIPHFRYRFNHPEKTETQLFLDFFKVYIEFLVRNE
jgi:hypothetical protein